MGALYRSSARSLLFSLLLPVMSSLAMAGDQLPDREIARHNGQGIPVLITDAFPQNYRDPDTGQVVGVDAATLDRLLELAGLKADYQITSWKRAIVTAESKADHLIMPLSRSRNREDRFVWLHPIRQTWYSIFGKGQPAASLSDIIETGSIIYLSLIHI